MVVMRGVGVVPLTHSPESCSLKSIHLLYVINILLISIISFCSRRSVSFFSKWKNVVECVGNQEFDKRG
jgi:hypothetical protein